MTRQYIKWLFAGGAIMVTALLPDIAFAQAPNPPSDRTSPPADAQDCAVPRDPSQKSDRVPQGKGDLSKKLDDCNGVLKAPESGDKGLVTPAPDTGNSRVIKPGDVPDNANPSNGSGG